MAQMWGPNRLEIAKLLEGSVEGSLGMGVLAGEVGDGPVVDAVVIDVGILGGLGAKFTGVGSSPPELVVAGFDAVDAHEAPLGGDEAVDEEVFGRGLGLPLGEEAIAEGGEEFFAFVAEFEDAGVEAVPEGVEADGLFSFRR